MTKARIYVVTTPAATTPRLVRAISQSQAIKHCTRGYAAAVATPDGVAEWMDKGVKVENAGAEAEAADGEQ